MFFQHVVGDGNYILSSWGISKVDKYRQAKFLLSELQKKY